MDPPASHSFLTSADIRGVLLDIEGTTTPISFVHEILFPYARAHVRDYLTAHFDSAETIADLSMLREEHDADLARNLSPPPLSQEPRSVELDSIAAYVHWLIDLDRKSPGLKSLQGRIWQQGYLDGSLRAPLFADVVPALKRWRDRNLKIAIFSSGSTLAQRLLFAHTEFGDVTNYIDDYFDTQTGPKTEPDSYRRIAAALRLRPAEMLFISDIVAELDAAGKAGMQTLLCVRPGNSVQASGDRHRIIYSFESLSG